MWRYLLVDREGGGQSTKLSGIHNDTYERCTYRRLRVRSAVAYLQIYTHTNVLFKALSRSMTISPKHSSHDNPHCLNTITPPS